jgi:hypothetical protein
MPRPPKPHKSKRLNLDLAVPLHRRLERIQKHTEADSVSEVIRRAVRVYDAILDAQADGSRVVVIDQDGTQRELLVV